MSHCTLSGNYTDYNGECIFNVGGDLIPGLQNRQLSRFLRDSAPSIPDRTQRADVVGAFVYLDNNILQGNHSNLYDYGLDATTTSQGYNLCNDIGGNWYPPVSFLTAIGDQTYTNAQLGPLQDNGGPTATMALLPGSPALDKGKSLGVTTDQRGLARPVDISYTPNATGGDGSDIGAFEAGSIAVRGDFNDDSFTDYLLCNSGTQKTAVWNLHGTTHVSGLYGPSLPPDWIVACVSDMNLDGQPDYVLFNTSTRRTAIWFLNHNVTFLRGVYGPTLPVGWILIAATNFNFYDGQPDYVLFNASTRRTAVWLLNSSVQFFGGVYGPTLPAGWTLNDAVDLDSNGKPDFLLSNSSTHQTAIWYLDDAVFATSVNGPTLPSGWTLAGAIDFNADGKPDYVLFEATTRRTAIWYLNGPTHTGSAYGPTLPTGYNLAAP